MRSKRVNIVTCCVSIFVRMVLIRGVLFHSCALCGTQIGIFHSSHFYYNNSKVFQLQSLQLISKKNGDLKSVGNSSIHRRSLSLGSGL